VDVSVSELLKDNKTAENNEILNDKTSTYLGFMNGNRFIMTGGIPRQDALENCELNASKNPTIEIYCTWGGEIIFDNRISGE
jgi:hypothetical protein